jgi:quercetin dioxygenase-like cupin family protein
MLHADLREIDLQPHHPQVLQSESEGRTILLLLPKGEELQEHQVHERAYLTVVDGQIEVADNGNQKVEAGAGSLFVFDPAERHAVRAIEDARLLLVLTPWPGDGHPSA